MTTGKAGVYNETGCPVRGPVRFVWGQTIGETTSGILQGAQGIHGDALGPDFSSPDFVPAHFFS
jgi:hypothetical protein